jgi:probable phosphoglycerate mutase
MTTTRVHLVRHGATVLSAEDRFAGSTDVALSDEGRRQVACLGQRLAAQSIAQVYASPMARTLETAAAIAAPHGLVVCADAALREIDHGRWEGLLRAEVVRSHPEEAAAWEADPFTFAPQGGESGLQVMARALPCLRQLLERHRGETIVVVSQKATIRLLLCALRGIDARGYRDRLDQSPACLNTLDVRDAVHARLVSLNDVSHYAECPLPAGPRLSPWWDRAHGS